MLLMEKYIIFYFELLKILDLSTNEYLLLELIISLSSRNGYCFATKSYLAKTLNISETAIYKILIKLESKNYIKRDSKNKIIPNIDTKESLVNTKESLEITKQSLAKESLEITKQSLEYTKESLDHTKQSLDYNNINNNINNNSFSFEKIKNESLKLEFIKYVEYRSEIGKPIKSQIEINTLIEELRKLSDNNPAKAIQIIRNAINGGYIYFVELKKPQPEPQPAKYNSSNLELLT